MMATTRDRWRTTSGIAICNQRRGIRRWRRIVLRGFDKIDVGGPRFDGSRFVRSTVRYRDDYTEAQFRQFSSCDNVVKGGGSSNGGLTMISIVDDDKSVRESASSLVRSLGYATATFASGKEFLESGCLSDTECLITDVRMPGMSGVDLQSRLIANGNRTPIIFVTASPDERTRERALGAGALGFLIKPINEESLIACLERATGTRNSGPQ
jgi:CheY-like chemotaxis protein